MSDATPWMAFAWADLGVVATPGPGISARVHQYYADAGHPEIAGDDVAWCAAFVGACLERAGIRSTRSLLARSYLTFGDTTTERRAGTIAVFSRGDDPSQGHVGFVVGETTDTISLLGGNQSHSVSVIAMPRARLLALRWPTALASQPASTSTQNGPQFSPLAPLPVTAVTTSDPAFQRALAHVLTMEGGYTDDPYDPGGPTNLGITVGDLASSGGIALTDATAADLKAAVQKLTPADVAPLYLSRYWLPCRADALPPSLALFHFDTAVNQGISAAIRMLQQTLDVDVDGDIGPLTLAAVAACDIGVTLADYADLRRDRYRALPTFWRFGRGWMARVDATLAAATQTTPTQLPAQPKDHPMTDTTPTSTPATSPTDPKWWGQSITIWGTIVTTLSTVLPIVGPIIGIQISADMVHQLGDSVIQVVQAIGGVVGILMTVYGRTRAIQPLVRRQFSVKF